MESFAKSANLPWSVIVTKLPGDNVTLLLYGKTDADQRTASRARDQFIRALTGPVQADDKPLADLPPVAPDGLVSFPNGPTMARATYEEFLTWVADRLVNVHGEKETFDYVLRLRELAASIMPYQADGPHGYLDHLLIPEPDTSSLYLVRNPDGTKSEVWPEGVQI